MKDIALLIGNDINNLSPGVSWAALLKDIIEFCGVSKDIEIHERKPFPLLYEEIFLSAIKKKKIEEKTLKTFIANQISKIVQNEIHERIRGLKVPHIMTTNYDFTIEGKIPYINEGLLNERLYSVFRRYIVEDTTYWHLHGDCKSPISINLGYEHYCGQLQNMRNYIVSGTEYKNNNILKESLIRRLKNKESINYQSWLDLFFTKDIYILGLSLDFIESDLWWLLTYRARSKFYKNAIPIKNKLYYFIPESYIANSKYKLDLFKANDVTVIAIDKPKGIEYYRAVLERLEAIK